MRYLPRCVDGQLERSLASAGAVLIEGPRACGKTETGLQHSKSFVRLDSSPDEALLAQEHPRLVLQGKSPRLIDEWQLAPAVWNAVRHEIDTSRQKGRFILSGSAVPPEDVTRHTGAGRFSRLRMRPMSLWESGDSTGEISVRALRRGQSEVEAVSEQTYEDLAGLVVRGGWPGLLPEPSDVWGQFNRDYLADMTTVELPMVAGRNRNPRRLDRLLRVLARNLGGEAKVSRIATEVSADGSETARSTVYGDLDVLARVFMYEPLQAWSVDLRSRVRLRTAERIYLTDPSLAVAALGAGPERLMRGREYFGFAFEAMVVRDLRTYAEADGASVSYYRDSEGLEVDVVLDYRDTWAAIEVKLGSTELEKAEANLLALASKVDTEKVGEPAFLAIVTGTKYAYTRPSGVHVIPLATLAM